MKKQLLKHLKTHPTSFSIEDLKQVFDISASDELVDLMKAINVTVEEADVVENSKHEYIHINHTNYMKGTLDLKAKGFGFLIPEDPKENDVFIPPKNTLNAMNQDYVLIHIDPVTSGLRQTGEIRKVLKRNKTHIIGEFFYKRKMGHIDSDDVTISQEVVVKTHNINGAKYKDKVRAKIINYSYKGMIECEITDVLGNVNDPGVDIESKILQHNIDPIFSDDVINAAKEHTTITKEELTGRTDKRDAMIITIDGDDAKDFDDAVTVTKTDSGYKLGVYIADVSHYVTKGSILDIEAYKRGTSVYLPGRVIPMLPEALSNEMCSLKPGVDRLTIGCEMNINKDGTLKSHEIFPAVIHSKYRMTYNKVNDIFRGNKELKEQYAPVVGMLYNMHNLAKALLKKREQIGSIQFETEESYIALDENQVAVDITKRERGVSEGIIEEFMLKANQVVAEHIFWMNLPFIYRVHDKPKSEKLKQLLRMTNALGYNVKAHHEISHHELKKLLDAIHGTKEEKGINLLMLRSMQKAIYSKQNIGHFGLAFEYYTHFTSPIRRYPDLIVHRLLRGYLFQKEPSLDMIEHYDEVMADVAKASSEAERRAISLERDVIDMKKAEYMQGFIGKHFDGIITSVTHFGVYVSLDNTVEGLVHISNLHDDYYNFDPTLLQLIGERKKKTYHVGQEVRIKVIGANPKEGDVDFVIVKQK